MYVNSRRRPAGVRSQVSKLHQLNHLYFRPGIDKFKNREEKLQSDQILFWSTGCTNGFKISIALLLNIHFEQPGCALKKDASPRVRYYAMIIKLYLWTTVYQISTQFCAMGNIFFGRLLLNKKKWAKKQLQLTSQKVLPRKRQMSLTYGSHLQICDDSSCLHHFNNCCFSPYASSSSTDIWMETKLFPVTSPSWGSLPTTKHQDSFSVLFVPRSSWP